MIQGNCGTYNEAGLSETRNRQGRRRATQRADWCVRQRARQRAKQSGQRGESQVASGDTKSKCTFVYAHGHARRHVYGAVRCSTVQGGRVQCGASAVECGAVWEGAVRCPGTRAALNPSPPPSSSGMVDGEVLILLGKPAVPQARTMPWCTRDPSVSALEPDGCRHG